MTTSLTRRNLDTLAIGDISLHWQQIATGHDGGTGWLHSGIAIGPDGQVLVAHPEGRDLLRIDADTTTRVPTPMTELHCITAARGDNGTPLVWVADNGHRFVADAPQYGEVHAPGRVAALALDGSVVRELIAPAHPGPWSPTSVAVVNPDDPRSDVWVADGYGHSLVHRFNADGVIELTLDGNESGLAFDCPHGILIRECNGQNQLYIADRANQRIVIYDLAGNHLRTIGTGAVDSPSSMIDYYGHLIVTELFGALAVFDGDDYLGHIGTSGRDHTEPVWPNDLDESGNAVAPQLTHGGFNSPHGITAGADGALYLTEWMIGGRVVRLAPDSEL